MQICNSNVFYHESYKIDSKAKINLIKGITMRYGNNAFINYYDLRVSMDQFQNEELIINTIAKMRYPNDKIIVSVDSIESFSTFKSVKVENIVNQQKYLLIHIQNFQQFIVINREADWKVISFILPIIFKSNFKVNLNHQQIKLSQYSPTANVNIVNLSRVQRNRARLNPAISMSIFIGKTKRYLLFLSESQTLYVYSCCYPYQHINAVALNLPESNFLQEYIPVIHEEQLIMYSIVKQAIILKHYKLPLGDLQFTKHFKWLNEYGPVDVDSLDLIAVPLLNSNKIRVFYVSQPDLFMDIMKPLSEWKIFSSKICQNISSDQTGYYGIYVAKRLNFKFYNFKQKQRLFQLQMANMTSIQFDIASNRAIINGEKYMYQYSRNGELIRTKQKQSIQNYCFVDGKIFITTNKSYRCEEDNDAIRTDNALLIYNSIPFSIGEKYQMRLISQIYQIQNS